jgi:hypothetical protein
MENRRETEPTESNCKHVKIITTLQVVIICMVCNTLVAPTVPLEGCVN